MSLVAASPGTYLQINRDWTRRDWQRPLAAADRISRRGGLMALQKLREIFPESMTGTLQSERHPLVARQVTYPGRTLLLELGVAAALLPLNECDVHRLRNATEFEATAAEICAGLMFRRIGAALERPQNGQHRCEYIATFSSGQRLAVEVKMPNVSDDESDLARIEFELLMALMAKVGWLSQVAPSAYATFHFAPGIKKLGNRYSIDTIRLGSWVEEAVVRAAEATRGRSPFGMFCLGKVGTLEVQAAPGLGRVQFSAVGPTVDAKTMSRRLVRNLLNKGAKQLAEPGLPGVIVLDIHRNGLVRNALPLLHRWAMKQPSLAAIIAIERHVIADGLYGCVDAVPGPLFDDALSLLSRLFDVCVEGHLHYNPLTRLGAVCPCTWLRTMN